VPVNSNRIARVLDPGGNLIRELKGHRAEIISAVFSHDGEYIVTAAKDNTARLWYTTPIKNKVKIFSRHTSERSDFFASFSPDGSRVLTVNAEKAMLWDLSGQSVKQGRPGKGDFRLGNWASFSPDGKYIIFLSDEDEKVGVWDLEKGGDKIVPLQLSAGVYSVVFSPVKGGATFAAASQDRTARLWDMEGKEIAVFKGHQQEVNFASFSPDGESIVTASWDHTARLWDLKGNEKQVFKGHDGNVKTAVFSADGKHIVTASSDGTAGMWDLTGSRLQVFEGHGSEVVFAMFSPDGKYIITASEDKTARIWNLKGMRVYEFKGFNEIIHAASFSPAGQYVLMAPAKGPALYRLIDPVAIIRTVNGKNVWHLDGDTKKKYNL
jgi:WD40 repeat protein